MAIIKEEESRESVSFSSPGMSLSSWRVEPARSRQTSGAARIDLPRFSPVTRPFRSGDRALALAGSFPAGETRRPRRPRRRHVGRVPPGPPLRHHTLLCPYVTPYRSNLRLGYGLTVRPIARHNWFYPTVSIMVLLALSAGACTDIGEQGNWIYNEYVWSRRWLTVFVKGGMKLTRHNSNEIFKTNNLLNKHNLVTGSFPELHILNFNIRSRFHLWVIECKATHANGWLESDASKSNIFSVILNLTKFYRLKQKLLQQE